MSEKRLSDRLDAEMESLFPGCAKIRAKGWNLCMDDDLEGFYTVMDKLDDPYSNQLNIGWNQAALHISLGGSRDVRLAS